MLKRLFSLALLATLITATIGSPAYASTTNVKQVVAGERHIAIIKTDNTLWMCGQNYQGQLGTGDFDSKPDPVQIMEGVKDVAVGKYFTAILKTDGTVWTCGSNGYGELGTTLAKNVFSSNVPIQVLTGVKDLSAGEDYVMVIKTDNTLWGWGSNSYGVLADDAVPTSAKPIKIMDKVWQVSAGASHVAAIKTNGSLWTWGDSMDGKLGYFTDQGIIFEPKQIMAYGVQSAVAGDLTTAIIKTDGTLWMCGNNVDSKLGTGKEYTDAVVYGTSSHEFYQPQTPVKVLTGVKSASLTHNSSYALKTDGSLWAWGDNSFAQLGTGNFTKLLSPTKITTGVTSLSAANNLALVTKADGSVWGCGAGPLHGGLSILKPGYDAAHLGSYYTGTLRQY